MKQLLEDSTITQGLSIHITNNNMFRLLISIAFCHFTLFSYFEVAIGLIPVISFFQVVFFPCIYTILVVLSYNRCRIKYIRIQDIALIAFFSFSILLTIIIYPQNEPFIFDSLFSHILPCIPFFFLGLCYDFKKETSSSLGVLSSVAIIASTAYVFYYTSTGRQVTGETGYTYNMYWSYLLLPNTLIAINYSFNKKKILAIVCSIIGIIYSIAMGTRGPVIIIFAYLAICLWRKISMNNKRKVFIICIIGFLIFAFVSSGLFLQTVNGLKIFLEQNGMSTRVIDHLLSGDIISNTTGRSDISEDLIRKLCDRLLLGYGVYGEWPFGYYSAHNMYLEIEFHYGIIIGSILLVSYVRLFIFSLLKYYKNKEVMDLLILFGILIFIKGIFGGRYLESHVFFLLGLCLQLKRRYYNKDTQIGDYSVDG